MSKKCRTYVAIKGDALPKSCEFCGHYFNFRHGTVRGCSIDDICGTKETEAKNNKHCGDFAKLDYMIFSLSYCEKRFKNRPYEVAYIKKKHGGYEYINMDYVLNAEG